MKIAMKIPAIFVRTISILLAFTFISSQVLAGQNLSTRSRDTLAASLVSDGSINPARSRLVQGEVAKEAQPGAIGNGWPLAQLVRGQLPESILMRKEERRRIAIALNMAIKLTVANKENVPAKHKKRAQQTLDNLIALRDGTGKEVHEFRALVEGREVYLLGFSYKNKIGLSEGLIYELYDISSKRLAQYIFHECVPEKGVVIERGDHRLIYNEIQSAIFGEDEVAALKGNLRDLINRLAPDESISNGQDTNKDTRTAKLESDIQYIRRVLAEDSGDPVFYFGELTPRRDVEADLARALTRLSNPRPDQIADLRERAAIHGRNYRMLSDALAEDGGIVTVEGENISRAQASTEAAAEYKSAISLGGEADSLAAEERQERLEELKSAEKSADEFRAALREDGGNLVSVQGENIPRYEAERELREIFQRISDLKGAIGNGAPLAELRRVTSEKDLPKRVILEDKSAQEIMQKLTAAIELAINLSTANQRDLPPAHQSRIEETMANLRTLRDNLSRDAYLYNADIRGAEDYLLGFAYKNYRGYAIELIQRLHSISVKRLAQYVFHECVPEKGVITERDDHRVVYNEIQSAIFGKDEVLALKENLRGFINEKTMAGTDKKATTATTPAIEQSHDVRNDLISQLQNMLGDRYQYYPGGFASIDITLKGIDKRSAVRDIFSNPERKTVYYFGNEFFKTGKKTGNDTPLLAARSEWKDKNREVVIFSVDENPDDRTEEAKQDTIWIGKGPEATIRVLRQIMDAVKAGAGEVLVKGEGPDSAKTVQINLSHLQNNSSVVFDVDGTILDKKADNFSNKPDIKGIFEEYLDRSFKLAIISGNSRSEQKARISDSLKDNSDISNFTLYVNSGATRVDFDQSGKDTAVNLSGDIPVKDIEAIRRVVAKAAENDFGLNAKEKEAWLSWFNIKNNIGTRDDFPNVQFVPWSVQEPFNPQTITADRVRAILSGSGIVQITEPFIEVRDDVQVSIKLLPKSVQITGETDKEKKNVDFISNISEDLPVRAQVLKTNLTKILAEHPDQLFFMGIENDIGESQKAQIMPIYKAIDEIKELKDASGKPLFPNLMARRGKAEELVKMAADLAKDEKLNLNNAFIGARKLSVDNKLYDSIKGEGRAWISAIDDSRSGDYLPVFESITVNMMAYLNADLSAIKNFYDAISDKPIDPAALQDMIRNRIIYILPRATKFDEKQLRTLYELAQQVYIAA